MRTITRIAAAVFAAAAIALGAAAAAGPDMHYHGPPVAGGDMHYHGQPVLLDAALAEMRPPLTPELIARSKLAAAIAAHREAPDHSGQWVFCADCKAALAR